MEACSWEENFAQSRQLCHSWNSKMAVRRRHCGNVTSAGWQVTLCDPMWHVSSRSGVATLRTAMHLLLTYLLTYCGLQATPVQPLTGFFTLATIAEHLTVESYTIIICQQSYLLLFGIPSPTHSFIPGLKPSFSANPSNRSPSFFFSGLTTWIPQTVYCYF